MEESVEFDENTLDQEYENALAEIAHAEHKLEQVELIERQVNEDARVCRMTMESLALLYPQVIDKRVPINSYTKLPSEQNLSYAQESVSLTKALAAVAVGAAVIGAIYALIRYLRASQMTRKAARVDKRIEHIEDQQKKEKLPIQKYDKPDVKTLPIQFAEASGVDIERTGRKSEKLIDAFRPGGLIAEIAEEHFEEMVNRITFFEKAIGQLIFIVRNAPESSVDEVERQAKRVQTNLGDRSIKKKVEEVAKLVHRTVDRDQTLRSFMNETLYKRDAFYEFMADFDNWKSIKPVHEKIARNSRFESRLASLEKEANDLERFYRQVESQDSARETQWETLNERVNEIQKNSKEYRDWFRFTIIPFLDFYEMVTISHMNYQAWVEKHHSEK